MDISINLGVLIGCLLSVMLSVIAWFIRQLHQDFRKVQENVNSLQQTAQAIQAESRSTFELLRQRIQFLEWRLGRYPGNVEQFKQETNEKIE